MYNVNCLNKIIWLTRDACVPFLKLNHKFSVLIVRHKNDKWVHEIYCQKCPFILRIFPDYYAFLYTNSNKYYHFLLQELTCEEVIIKNIIE